MRNKENCRKKRESSKDLAKKSNLTSLIFESCRNSLVCCSPRADTRLRNTSRPQQAKLNEEKAHLMQYFGVQKATPDLSRRNSLCTRRPATPMPARITQKPQRYSLASAYEKGWKSSRYVKPQTPKIATKLLQVKGSNVLKQNSVDKHPNKSKLSTTKQKQKQKVIKPNKMALEAEEAAKEEQLLNKSFKGFQFYRDLGISPHAIVKSGVDWLNRRKIAVKMYKRSQLSEKGLARLRREIEILGSIDHSNVIKLLQIIETLQTVNIVMEYGGGNSLEQHIRSKTQGRFDEPSVKKIFRQLLQTIDYLHSHNIAHRNITPENIVLNKHLQLKLINFACSVRIGDTELNRQTYGAAPYMPPETFNRLPHDPKSIDSWSLGVVLYTILHGQCPFLASTQKELAGRICKGDYTCAANISHLAKQLIAGFLQVQPSERLTPHEALKSAWLSTDS